MAISSTDLLLYKSKIVNDQATNGGRMSSTEIVSGVSNNLWPDVTESQRTAGYTLHRKVFYKVANSSNLDLFNTGIFIDKITPADDRVIFFAATQIDTESDVTGSERHYGCGSLNLQADTGATTLSVAVEDGTDIVFVDGDRIRITDKADPNAVTGNEEFQTISGAPVVAGDIVTITLVGTLQFTYLSGTASRVHSVYEAGDVQTSYSDAVVTSTSGTFDPANFLVLDNIGTVYEELTFLFSDDTNFTCSGDTLGDLGSGTTAITFAPINSDYSVPYASFPATIWGGTFANGDTVVLKIWPAAAPLWEKRIVPAGTASYAGNSSVLGIVGESSS